MNELKLPFQKTIDELLAGKKSLSRSSLRSFSDIDSVSLNLLLEAWPRIASDRKRLLLEELQTLSDNDTLVSFDDLARVLLNDRMRRCRPVPFVCSMNAMIQNSFQSI
jgi:hypothetical protein